MNHLNLFSQFNNADVVTHLYAKSIAIYRRGELEAAMKVVKDLIEIAPQDAFFHEFSGDILLSMAKPNAAARAYKRAISIRPDSPQMLLNYGRALIASNKATDLTDAISALEQARNGEPNGPSFTASLPRLWASWEAC